MLGLVSKWLWQKLRSKYAFGLVFLQQERPCENEIHWIMFNYYQSQSTDIHLNQTV